MESRTNVMDKSPDAFRTISEVAEDLDLPQHVLRFWETRFTQIKPMKRGGGRRYYRPQDVDLIKGIRHMLYDQGYTIKGVQKLLRDRGIAFIGALGAGNVEAANALLAARDAEETAEKPAVSDGDTLLGQPRAKPSRRFFGFGKEEEGAATPAAEAGRLTRDNRALLQEALFDLLECKRLLDQVR